MSKNNGAATGTVDVPRPSARSGAAARAYEKRRQRARVVQSSSAGSIVSTRSVAARLPFVALVLGLLTVGLASTLLLTTRAAEDSYRLSADRRVNQSLGEQVAGLQRDVEAANSAPELAARAKSLGMIPTRDVPRLLVAPDGTVTVVGTPAPATGLPAPDFDAAPAPAPAATAPAAPAAASSATQVASAPAAAPPPRAAGGTNEQLVPVPPPNTGAR